MDDRSARRKAARLEQALAKRRREVEELDGEILRLLCRRMEVVRSIGRTKSRHRLPLRNFEVEAEVERRLKALSAARGHGENLGLELARFLIGVSLEVQAPFLDSAPVGERFRVLVVGGAGGMGRWLCRFLGGQGHTVRVYDPSPLPTPYPRARRLEPWARRADLLFLAVPMDVCGVLLLELANLRPAGLVAELCSLKDHLRPSLQKARERGLRVASFHPMFGPETTTLSGKKILFCRDGHVDDLARLKSLFEGTSADLLEVDLADHDRLMGWVLGLVHLSNLALARTLERGAPPFIRLRQVEGVTFHRQAETTVEVASENPPLYFDIQRLNPYTEETAGLLARSLEELRLLIRTGDAVGFEALMERSRGYFYSKDRSTGGGKGRFSPLRGSGTPHEKT